MYTTYILYTDRNFRKQAAKAGLSACLEKNTLFLRKTELCISSATFTRRRIQKPNLYVLRLAHFKLLWTALWELMAFQASYFCMCTSAFLLGVALVIHKHLLMVLQRLQITFFPRPAGRKGEVANPLQKQEQWHELCSFLVMINKTQEMQRRGISKVALIPWNSYVTTFGRRRDLLLVNCIDFCH